MRTKGKLAATGLAMAMGFSLAACSVPLCEEHPDDARCKADMGTSTDFAVSSTRLSKNGGRVNVVAKVASGTRVVLQFPGGLEVACTIDASGNGYADVSMTQLASIAPGQITVTLKGGDKSIQAKLRVYQPASFVDMAAAKAALSTGTRQPTWVQVAKGHVFSAEENATNRRINEYAVNGTTLSGQLPRDPLTNTVLLTTVLDVTDTQVLRTTMNGAMYSVENTDIAVDMYTSFKTANLTKVNDIRAKRDGSMFVVAGEGTDGPLKAFTLPAPGGMTSTSVMLGGATTKAVARAGVGKLTDASTLDVIAAHADGASVFTQKTGAANPSLDQTLSTAVGSKLAAGLTAMAVGDIDGDGLDDIIAAQGTNVLVLSVDVSPTTQVPSVTSTQVLSNLSAMVDAVAVGDVTGDGKADLIVAQKAAAMLTVFINQAQ